MMLEKGIPGTNLPVWDAESAHPGLCDQLRKGFSEISDPELGLNIIQLGLIRNVKIDDQGAIVKMILTTPFCPYGPAMLESARQKAEQILETPVGIDFGMEAWDFSMMEEGLGTDWGLF
ncbi:MAG: iron-sulfur cluster assembly protein [Chloroflexi bacterium]|nr:iron-sulfur cluster assembly protein [Chloroflexota bacterium]